LHVKLADKTVLRIFGKLLNRLSTSNHAFAQNGADNDWQIDKTCAVEKTFIYQFYLRLTQKYLYKSLSSAHFFITAAAGNWPLAQLNTFIGPLAMN